MRKLTVEKCQSVIEGFKWMAEEGPGMSIRDEYDLQAYQIALPVLEQQEINRDVTLRESIAEIRKLTEESGGYKFEALREEQDNSDWISCSERTPEPLDWVIAYDEVGTVKAYICPHTKEWVRDNGDELYRVSHWQPLPAPPNTQNSGDDCRESGMEQTNNGSAA